MMVCEEGATSEAVVLEEEAVRILIGKVLAAVLEGVEIMVGGIPPLIQIMDPISTPSTDIAGLITRAGMGHVPSGGVLGTKQVVGEDQHRNEGVRTGVAGGFLQLRTLPCIDFYEAFSL